MTTDFMPCLSSNERDYLLEGLAFISRVFWGPEQKTSAEIVSGSSLRWASNLVPLLDPSFSEAMTVLETIIQERGDCKSLKRYLEETYICLFVNARDGVPAPLYQSCYEAENAPLMGPPATMMKERLESASLSMAGKVNEPPDHLSVQIEYLYFLLEKGFRERDQAIIADASSFASENMLPWVIQFRDKINDEMGSAFYASMASVLLCILDFIGRFKVQDGLL